MIDRTKTINVVGVEENYEMLGDNHNIVVIILVDCRNSHHDYR